MASRIGSIIAIADRKSDALIEAMPEGSRSRSNVEGIVGICRALLKRRTPIRPTAGTVSEEGRRSNPHFPLERTIYNSYANAIKIWSKAYHDIMNIDTDPPISAEDVSRIDTTVMEPSTANLVDRMKAIIFELTQRCNVLKQIVDEGVPVAPWPVSEAEDAEAILRRLKEWLEGLVGNGFDVDDAGVRVSRRTPPQSRVMNGRLYGDLKRFLDEFERLLKAKRASEKWRN